MLLKNSVQNQMAYTTQFRPRLEIAWFHFEGVIS